MAKGILYCETHPRPEDLEAYHRSYDEVHLEEVVHAVDGVVSARRYTPLRDGDPFVAVYEIEGDSVPEVQERVLAFMRSGEGTSPSGVDASKPVVVRFYELRTTYP